MDHYAECFSLRSGHCFRMIQNENGTGYAQHSPFATVWRGRFQDNAGNTRSKVCLNRNRCSVPITGSTLRNQRTGREPTMAFSTPMCPACDSWDVRAVYAPTGRGNAHRETVSGECRACGYEWTQVSPLEAS
jgi:hypothetical protein